MPRILIIDDDPSVGRAVKVLLEHRGFEVTATESGITGIELFESARFDAVIVDIFMPDMDGLTAIKTLHRLNPSVPIIAISGFMDLYAYRDSADRGPDILAMAAEHGAVRNVQKPFRPHELLRALEETLSLAA